MIFFRPQAVPSCSVFPVGLEGESGICSWKAALSTSSSQISFLCFFTTNKWGNLKNKKRKPKSLCARRETSASFVLVCLLSLGGFVAQCVFPKHLHAGPARWASRHLWTWSPRTGHLPRQPQQLLGCSPWLPRSALSSPRGICAGWKSGDDSSCKWKLAE